MVDENRRALLRRAAVAGGLAWVTPVVLADPARADTGTPKCRASMAGLNMTVTLSRGGSGSNRYPRVTLAITGSPSSCPCAGQSLTSQVAWVGTPPSGTRLFRVAGGTAYTSGTYQTNNGTNRIMDLVDTGSTNDLNVAIPNPGGFTLTAFLRYQCASTGRTSASACASRSITYGWNGLVTGDIVGTTAQGTLAKNVAC